MACTDSYRRGNEDLKIWTGGRQEYGAERTDATNWTKRSEDKETGKALPKIVGDRSRRECVKIADTHRPAVFTDRSTILRDYYRREPKGDDFQSVICIY